MLLSVLCTSQLTEELAKVEEKLKLTESLLESKVLHRTLSVCLFVFVPLSQHYIYNKIFLAES